MVGLAYGLYHLSSVNRLFLIALPIRGAITPQTLSMVELIGMVELTGMAGAGVLYGSPNADIFGFDTTEITSIEAIPDRKHYTGRQT